MATMQYAKFPQFQYQKFEGHRYQTYNPQTQTLGFSYHPIIPKPATPAPPEKDNKEVTDNEPEKKENTEQQVAAEENPPAPAEESPAPPQDEGNVIVSINKFTPTN